MGKARVNRKVLRMSEVAILTAIILLMSFTPIGYIKTAGLEITLITIPVIVGAIVLGPGAGAFLGTVFGITSFLQCVMGLSPFGTAALEISVPRTFIICVPPRILMGLLTGLFYKLFKKKNFAAYSITSLTGSLLNTVLFMTALVICFWNTEFIQGFARMLGTEKVVPFIFAFVGVNGLIEAVTCFVLASAISKAVDYYVNKN